MMNSTLERQLATWAEEAERQGSGAVYAVLQLLHNSYVEGSHNKFARHCSEFSPVRIAGMEVKPPQDQDEFPFGLDLGEFRH